MISENQFRLITEEVLLWQTEHVMMVPMSFIAVRAVVKIDACFAKIVLHSSAEIFETDAAAEVSHLI